MTCATVVCIPGLHIDAVDDGEVWGDKTVEIDTMILRAMQEAAEAGTRTISPLVRAGSFCISATVLRCVEPVLQRAELNGADAHLLLCDIVGA